MNVTTNSAETPLELCQKLATVPPQQRLRLVSIAFNPEDPKMKWIAFLEQETEPESGASS